jgi:hypothetical protein
MGYRLYSMDGLGRFGDVEELAAKDDGEAVSLAYAKSLPVDCEIWHDDRLVAMIPARLDCSFAR